MPSLNLIIADVAAFVFSFCIAISVYMFVKHFRADKPITLTFAAEGIIDPSSKGPLLAISFISALLAFLFFAGLTVAALLFANVFGYVAAAVGLVLGLFVFKPAKERYTVSRYTLNDYAEKHKAYISRERFKAYMKTVK